MSSPEHSAPHYYRPLSVSGLEGCLQCWNCGTLWHLGKYWLHDHVSTEQPPCAALQVDPGPLEAWMSTASSQSSSPPRLVTNRAVGSVEGRIHTLLQADTRLAGSDTCGMQIKFHPNGDDLLGWLGSSLPDLYLKSHPNASQRPSNGRKTPEPCE